MLEASRVTSGPILVGGIVGVVADTVVVGDAGVDGFTRLQLRITKRIKSKGYIFLNESLPRNVSNDFSLTVKFRSNSRDG